MADKPQLKTPVIADRRALHWPPPCLLIGRQPLQQKPAEAVHWPPVYHPNNALPKSCVIPNQQRLQISNVPSLRSAQLSNPLQRKMSSAVRTGAPIIQRSLFDKWELIEKELDKKYEKEGQKATLPVSQHLELVRAILNGPPELIEKNDIKKRMHQIRSWLTTSKVPTVIPLSLETIGSEKESKEEAEYPFPKHGFSRYVYRWVSKEAAKEAKKNGIIKQGGIHDGIPTLLQQIDKEFAKKGGGIGIICADVELVIDTEEIPEIKNKKANSVHLVKGKKNMELKILVSIPKEAIL